MIVDWLIFLVVLLLLTRVIVYMLDKRRRSSNYRVTLSRAAQAAQDRAEMDKIFDGDDFPF